MLNGVRSFRFLWRKGEPTDPEAEILQKNKSGEMP